MKITSSSLDGSDAMNPDPDYSAAYVVLETDGAQQGHGLTFTIGRGNDIVCKALEALTCWWTSWRQATTSC